MKIRISVSGRGYRTTDAIPAELVLPEGSSVADALTILRRDYGSNGELADSCLVAVSGNHLGTLRDSLAHRLRDGDDLLIFAPVAGG